MGFEEGSIVLNSADDTYFAGQVIYGKLVFEQDKVKTFRGIYVKIKGFCKVHWTTTHTRRENDRSHTYTENHDSYEEYFSMKTYLRGGENGEYHLQPGKHEMPFECPIPASCPSSFEGTYGHVRYRIKVVVDRAFKVDQEKTRDVRVIAPLNLSADPYCQEPLQFDIEDSYCCCCTSSGSSETVVKAPSSGVWPGQRLPLEASCSNQGRVGIDHIKLAIHKRVTFHATQKPGTKHESESVVELKKGPVPGGATRSWALELQLPVLDACNLAACRYIDVDYEFKVTVSPEGCHSASEDTRRIVVGTAPDQLPLAPQQQLTALATQPAYPSYPGSPNPPYSSQISPYPAQNSLYPHSASYPEHTSPYPTQNTPYPAQTAPYPPQSTPYPPQSTPYPPQNTPYPPQSTPYPPQSTPYPHQSTPYPPHSTSYPAQTLPYLAQGGPYPPPTSPFPPSAPPAPPQAGFPAPPALSPMPVANVADGRVELPSEPPPPYNPNFVDVTQGK